MYFDRANLGGRNCCLLAERLFYLAYSLKDVAYELRIKAGAIFLLNPVPTNMYLKNPTVQKYAYVFDNPLNVAIYLSVSSNLRNVAK